MGADDEQITTALDALIDGYASAMVRVEQEFCCSGAESTALYAEVNTVVEAAEAEVATLRADLAAVRTDLSVAREALRLICTEGLTVERCFELASSGLTATPPVAQLDP